MDDLCRVNLAQMAGSKNYQPNGMNCHIGYRPFASSRIPLHVTYSVRVGDASSSYRPIASSRVPLHVAYSGRVGHASSLMDDLCPVNLAQMACSTKYNLHRLISVPIYHINRCKRSCNQRLVAPNKLRSIEQLK